jgi:malate dehydrogenase (oxaloacetate-decarboxylating)(NADP+)
MKIRKEDALEYHAKGKPGKIEVVPTKPYTSQRDLSLAYSPGVAVPCLEIAEKPDDVYKYTAKGNLVAVITNGTAVLGLGDIGPLASKPVMEGKGLLFKIYADIDVFDIEINEKDPEKFIQVVKAIAPTFGGINLEDIKAPEAFEIEERLKAELDIPLMHDDQHGTAIISGAGLLNALEIAGKSIETVKIVINGAGASAISCGKLYVALGAKRENIIMLDSTGVIHAERTDLNKYKDYFVQKTALRTLPEAIKGADVFLGLSKGNVLSQAMIQSMAENPIVFALANPDPEIEYDLAKAARPDVLIATGRSDHPNQINNVLGFPYIFRGALDVRATQINEAMKMAAVRAIAKLAKEPVPEEVTQAYGLKNLSFGRDNFIPKPLDPRLIVVVAPAVARAAMESGVAKEPILDWEHYADTLRARIGRDEKLIRQVMQKIAKTQKKLVLAEGEDYSIIKAAQQIKEEDVAIPVLLGNAERIAKVALQYGVDLDGIEILDPKSEALAETRARYAKSLFAKRCRKGLTEYDAMRLMRERNHFGAMMLEEQDADCLITGVTRKYKESIEPALKVLGMGEGVQKLAGMYVLLTKQGPLFLADTTININPSVDDLVNITLMAEKTVRLFGIEPHIALLSYDNFGYSNTQEAEKVTKAVEILHRDYPKLVVDGGIQANFALNNDLLKQNFPFSKLAGKKTNTLVFPNLAAGNITYKILQQETDCDSIGPILLGVRKPYHVMQLGANVREIVNMARIAVLNAVIEQ